MVWTLNRDYISNHTYFVAVYVVVIAKLIKWKGPYDALMFKALLHDLDELVSGDLVSPVKAEILDVARADVYLKRKLNERIPHLLNLQQLMLTDCEDRVDEMKLILKAADRLDALLFLIVEQRLGNTVIGPRIPDATAQLREAWFKLPGLEHHLTSIWREEVLPSIEAHKAERGFGV